jgi:hypothetical protein
MTSWIKKTGLGGFALACVLLTGCATTPGGIAASSTPLEGRAYVTLGRTAATDSRICLFGIIPISSGNSMRAAVDEAARNKGGDALIDVTVEGSHQYWILFSRDITRVEGIAIRFTK